MSELRIRHRKRLRPGLPGASGSTALTGRSIWSLSAVGGALTTLSTSFGLVAVFGVLALALVVVVRSGGLVGLSGLLTGFGATWVSLIARQLSGADNDLVWLAVGLVPLAVGLAFLAFLVRNDPPSPSPERR